MARPFPKVPIEDRFWTHIRVTEAGCWEWTGKRRANGYGLTSINRRDVRAHRMAWTLSQGPIPDGLCVCHHCDNPPCVNPAHLFLGTKGDNLRDMCAKGRDSKYNAKKTHCKHGHPFDESNTRISQRDLNGKLRRSCRKCSVLNTRKWNRAHLPHLALKARERRAMNG